MDTKEFVYKVATRLSLVYGDELPTVTNELVNKGGPRSTIIENTANVAVIAHFIVTVAPHVIAIWTKGTNPSTAKRTLRESSELPKNLDSETAGRVTDAMVDELESRD
jgi:hypothetical protein